MARNFGRDEALIKRLQGNPDVKKALKDAENDRIERQYGKRGEK